MVNGKGNTVSGEPFDRFDRLRDVFYVSYPISQALKLRVSGVPPTLMRATAWQAGFGCQKKQTENLKPEH